MGKESASYPETQTELLPETIRHVVQLYTGDLLTRHAAAEGFKTQTDKDRNELWDTTAQKYPAFGEQIRKLRKRMQVVAEHEKNNPQASRYARVFFEEVEDYGAQEFLTDVFLSRIIPTDQIEHETDAEKKLQEMAQEMKLGPEGWRTVTLGQCVKAVLKEDLRIA